MARILIVEDNNFIREAIVGYLLLAEHQALEFSGTKGVLEVFDQSPPDLVILDVMLPDGNGFSLGKMIRKRSDVPLIFLTAKDSESDRITGFEIGADDYVVKPFSTRELSLRVDALLKRCRFDSREDKDIIRRSLENHTFIMNISSHSLFIDDSSVQLTGAEWKILEYLASQERVVISRSQILSVCLNYFFEGSERTIDTHIANLRAKLGEVEWIKTVRGFGYRFNGFVKTE
jgi:two-component system phosphate regulon response regulator PhoB